MYGRERRGGFGRSDSGDRRGGFGHGGGGGFRGGGSSFSSEAKPVKVGEEHDVTITDVGAKGDGITKVNNFVIFVAGAKKGEKCKIKIKEVADKFAIAEKIGEGSSDEAEDSEETKEEKKEESEESDDTKEDLDEGSEDKEE